MAKYYKKKYDFDGNVGWNYFVEEEIPGVGKMKFKIKTVENERMLLDLISEEIK